MPSRTPETFIYPVIYPNGAVIYCDTEEEQQELKHSIEVAKEIYKEYFK